MKKLLSVAFLTFLLTFSAAAQTSGVSDRMATDGPPTVITDDAEISVRFDRIAGDWNFLYATVPAARRAPAIYHMTFSHTGSTYSATFTVSKSDVGSAKATAAPVTPPYSYVLTDVSDGAQAGYARTQLLFQLAHTTSAGDLVTSSFVIFLVPGTGRMIGIDFADFTTGDKGAVPDLDGFWAGVRGSASDIDTFDPMARDLYQQYARQGPGPEQGKVFATWAGYGPQ